MKSVWTFVFIFILGAALGFVMVETAAQCKTVVVPVREARHIEPSYAVLQCPVNTRGLMEWREACKARGRMGQVRP